MWGASARKSCCFSLLQIQGSVRWRDRMHASRQKHVENGTLICVQDRDHAKKPSQKNINMLPFYTSHPCLSPTPLISLLPEIKLGPVDCKHLVTLQVTALIEKYISSFVFPICYYPLLEITPPKLQSVGHTNTHCSAGRAASQELSLIHLRKKPEG